MFFADLGKEFASPRFFAGYPIPAGESNIMLSLHVRSIIMLKLVRRVNAKLVIARVMRLFEPRPGFA
jgi:hypothetical protein